MQTMESAPIGVPIVLFAFNRRKGRETKEFNVTLTEAQRGATWINLTPTDFVATHWGYPAS